MDREITADGAIGDGVCLCTDAIQRCVDAVAASGGGRVVVPAGTFVTGTVQLRSRVTLDLRQGARLRGSPRLEDYRHPLSWFWRDRSTVHLVQAVDAEHVVITGEGEIAGSGPAFWEESRASEWDFWRERERPEAMVRFERCRHVRVEHVTLRESPGWTLLLHDCESARVQGVTIRNSFFGPNTDGMDIANCRGVTIDGCDIATGDDAIALMASRFGGPSEDIAITGCVLRTSCVGLRIIGFDDAAIHRRIVATGLLMPRTSRLLDVRSMNGALIEDVAISSCVGTTDSGWPINRPFEIVAVETTSRTWGDTSVPRLRDGLVRGISLRDLDIVTDGRAIVGAQRPHAVEDVRLSDLRLRYVMLDDPRPMALDADDSLFFAGAEHADVRGARAAIVAKDVAGLRVRDLAIAWPRYPVPSDWRLLHSPHRLFNPTVYRGNDDRIRSGELRPTFKAMWMKGCRDASVDLDRLADSEGGAPAEIADAPAASCH